MARLENPPDADHGASNIPTGLRVTATTLRVLFIFLLLALTVRVALPQSETIWTAYETPNDLIRFLLGVAVCLWLGFQLFRGPTDVHGYRTWLYLGFAAVPFAAICLAAVW
jgi:hypothetical protein